MLVEVVLLYNACFEPPESISSTSSPSLALSCDTIEGRSTGHNFISSNMLGFKYQVCEIKLLERHKCLMFKKSYGRRINVPSGSVIA